MINLFLKSGLLIVCILLTGCKGNTSDLFEKQKLNDDWNFLLSESDASEDQFINSEFDDSGTIVQDPEQEISFSFEGDAEFIGPNPAIPEAGIATILLRAGKQPGLIEVTAISSGLSSGTIQFESVNTK